MEQKHDDTVNIESIVDTQAVHENVTYVSSRDQYGVDVDNDVTAFDDGLSDVAPLRRTLERPVKINEFVWTYNSIIRGDLDIWNLWQSDPFVKSKLENFAYLRCNLNVKIVCSASPFHYGRMMFNYVPYGDKNEIWFNNKNTLYTSGASGSEEAYMQYLSTYPITGYVNPSANNVVNLKIPFIWHKNFISVNGIDGVGKETLGSLTYSDLNILSKANPNASDTVNVSVFCWASDVILQMPTNLTPTAGGKSMKRVIVKSDGIHENESAEVKNGVLSSTASAVANIAGRLTDAPIIGPFARATKIGAGAFGDIARIFGFSNPSMNVTAQPRSLRLYRNLANTIGQDTAEKMSFDPLQELTIDPRVIGWGGTDEMSVSTIVSKEQWLGKGQWKGSVGQFVTADATKIVLAALVSPVMTRRTGPWGAAPVRRAIQPCPAAHLSHMFKYWRGKIIYRIEVVSSQYHSGALQIQFDPMVKSAGVVTSDVYTSETNTRQTVILDISETNEVEIEIDYVSHAPFLKCRNLYTDTTFTPGATTDTSFNLETIFDPDYDMGMLTVSVLNELVAPGDASLAPGAGAGCDVNIWMRCDSDLVFSQPIGGWETDIFNPTSGNLTEWQKKVLVKAEDTQDDVLTFFGEKVVSIRSLLKRPVITHFNTPKNQAVPGVAQRVDIFMPHFGPEVNRSNLANRRNCYETYLSPMYLAKRGGMRQKFLVFNGYTGNEHSVGYMCISRQQSDTTVAGLPTAVNDDVPTRNSLLPLFESGSEGMQVTEIRYNPTVDIETPFYSNTRFTLACHTTNINSSYDLLKNPTMTQILYTKVQLYFLNAGNTRYVNHTSVGEDFALMCFQAPPTHYEFT